MGKDECPRQGSHAFKAGGPDGGASGGAGYPREYRLGRRVHPGPQNPHWNEYCYLAILCWLVRQD